MIIWIIAVFKTNHIQLKWARFTCHDFIFFQFDEHSDAAAETKLKKGIIIYKSNVIRLILEI